MQFLSSIPKAKRLQIRSIILHEDREAVAFPHSHGRGLIPFCTENNKLRIERRVNLWRNAFISEVGDAIGIIKEERGGMGYWEQLHSEVVTKSLTPWITETLAIPKLGMPINAFTLVLDGDAIPQKTSQVFEIVKRDAAWQAALDQWYAYHNKTPSSIEREAHVCYAFGEFPDVVRDLVENRPGSIIRCNFPTDDLWDAEHVFEENRHWMLASDWQDAWRTHRPNTF
jgi:hypothetical protein